MENGFGDIVNDQEDQGQPCESEEVSTHDEGQVEDSVLDPWWHVLLLDLLEVELGKDVNPIGDLDDEKELEKEGHVIVGITLPDGGHVQEVLPEDEISAPEEGNQVEGYQLTGLIELVVLDLAEVELLVDLVQEVLLDDRVHYH